MPLDVYYAQNMCLYDFSLHYSILSGEYWILEV